MVTVLAIASVITTLAATRTYTAHYRREDGVYVRHLNHEGTKTRRVARNPKQAKKHAFSISRLKLAPRSSHPDARGRRFVPFVTSWFNLFRTTYDRTVRIRSISRT